MRAPIRRLVSVGSIVADIRVDAPRWPQRGGDVIASAASIRAGGGFNILAAAARNGLSAVFAGRHGAGPFGDRIRAELAREDIAALLPAATEGDSGFCLVLVEPDGERTFITSPGVEAAIGERRLDDMRLTASDAVFVSGYDLSYPALGGEILRWLAAAAREAWLAFDPGPLVGDIPAAVLHAAIERASLLTLNRREAARLSGCEAIGEMAQVLTRLLGDGAVLVIRSGAEGCFIAVGADRLVHLSAPVVESVDTTGAGDAHTGVFLASLARGLDPLAAAARANAAAALSVTRKGPATAPSAAELDGFVRQF